MSCNIDVGERGSGEGTKSIEISVPEGTIVGEGYDSGILYINESPEEKTILVKEQPQK